MCSSLSQKAYAVFGATHSCSIIQNVYLVERRHTVSLCAIQWEVPSRFRCKTCTHSRSICFGLRIRRSSGTTETPRELGPYFD